MNDFCVPVIRKMAKSIFLIPSWTPPKFPTIKLSAQANFQQFKSSRNAHACLSKYPLASKIMVRNLPYSASESSLQKEFSKFGKIAEVKLVKDEKTNKSKGYAFIQYNFQEDALLALDNMDQKYFDGRIIFIDLANPEQVTLVDILKRLDPLRSSICPIKIRIQNEENRYFSSMLLTKACGMFCRQQVQNFANFALLFSFQSGTCKVFGER